MRGILKRRPSKADAQFEHLDRLLHLLHRKVNFIMATQAELANDLRNVTTQITKIGVETAKTLQKVIDLEELLANGGNTTPEVDEALAALKAQAQLTDDLVPDVA
jgi:hypothetical protein